ncbi:MAG: TerB family tellurite resistance protein [Candidatus Sumerlaeaceae bacterium]|nr:TerB family tellurite resistance protein [Candidatus Sumerlaeaceae bacterium]
MNNETRKLMKLLHLSKDETYHVFCLALCMGLVDQDMPAEEGETLTRIGFGLGLSPEEISELIDEARTAIKSMGLADVASQSLARLKERLDEDQMRGIKQILRYVAGSDKKMAPQEKALMDLVNEVWED